MAQSFLQLLVGSWSRAVAHPNGFYRIKVGLNDSDGDLASCRGRKSLVNLAVDISIYFLTGYIWLYILWWQAPANSHLGPSWTTPSELYVGLPFRSDAWTGAKYASFKDSFGHLVGEKLHHTSNFSETALRAWLSACLLAGLEVHVTWLWPTSHDSWPVLPLNFLIILTHSIPQPAGNPTHPICPDSKFASGKWTAQPGGMPWCGASLPDPLSSGKNTWQAGKFPLCKWLSRWWMDLLLLIISFVYQRAGSHFCQIRSRIMVGVGPNEKWAVCAKFDSWSRFVPTNVDWPVLQHIAYLWRKMVKTCNNSWVKQSNGFVPSKVVLCPLKCSGWRSGRLCVTSWE